VLLTRLTVNQKKKKKDITPELGLVSQRINPQTIFGEKMAGIDELLPEVSNFVNVK
jgi:hypothetical protein